MVALTCAWISLNETGESASLAGADDLNQFVCRELVDQNFVAYLGVA